MNHQDNRWGKAMSAPVISAQKLRTAMIRWGIYACFFLSGATALVFEVVWSRQFVTVFGNSSYAISTVLCAYMAGLGLGGLFGGRVADRVVQRAAVYGVIQAGVAVWAMAIGPILGWFRELAPTVQALSPERFWASMLVRFGTSFAILVVPCFLMGMTLPILARAVTGQSRFIGMRIGVLYCLNTLGAALGCLGAGFWMADTMGLRQMNFVAVMVSLGVAIAAAAMSRPMARAVSPASGEGIEREIPDEREASEEQAAGGLLLGAAFLNGLAGLACEVLWIRYMVFLVNSTYIFPTILCFYLLGMGLGSMVYGVFAGRIRRSARALGIVEILLALSVPATFVTTALIFATGPPAPLELKRMAFITVSLPAMLMGIAFPLLCAVYGRRVEALGRRVGLVFAVNTAGTVAGSLLPVFVIVPMMGIQKGIMLVSALYGAMGLAILFYSGAGNRRLAVRAAVVYAVILVVLFVIVPSNLCQRVFLATDFTLAKHTDILFYREGRTGTAIVTRDRANNCKTIYINGVAEVPVLYPHQLCFKMIGDLAPMLHNDPEDVLMICFGGGIAAGATTQIPEVKHLTIVDLESSVVEAAKLVSKENNGLLENPKVKVVIDDGRNYLMMSGRKWPVIVSDSTHPKSGDSWVLYTQEFYRLVREHLTEDGVFVEWVPIHRLHTEEFKIIVRTFESVFPHANLWIIQGIDEQCQSGVYTLLAGTMGPLKIDASKLRERLRAGPVRGDLGPFGLDSAAGFLDAFCCGEGKLKQWTGEGPVNTDDRPYTQYETVYSHGAMFNNAQFIELMEEIWPYLSGTGSEADANRLKEELSLRAKATRLALQGRLEDAYAVLPWDVRYRQMRKIYEQVPGYVKTLTGMYWDNPKMLLFLARLRSIGPGGVGGAVPIYERVLELEGENEPILKMLGIMRMNAGQLKEAEDYLRRAERLTPGSAEAEDNLGLCLAKQGRIEEAVDWFSRAVQNHPTLMGARIHFAVALSQTGRGQEAIDQLRYVLKAEPENETALKTLKEIEGQTTGPK